MRQQTDSLRSGPLEAVPKVGVLTQVNNWGMLADGDMEGTLGREEPAGW